MGLLAIHLGGPTTALVNMRYGAIRREGEGGEDLGRLGKGRFREKFTKKEKPSLWRRFVCGKGHSLQ